MRPAPSSATTLDTLVVGAGPAGIGTAIALSAIDDLVFGVVDRGVIGQTFLDWPEEQTFLTPSFTGNGFGATVPPTGIAMVWTLPGSCSTGAISHRTVNETPPDPPIQAK